MRLSPAVALAFIVLIGGEIWRAQPQDPAAAAQPQDPAAAAAAAVNNGQRPQDPAAIAENPAAMQLVSQTMNARFNNFSAIFKPDIKKHLGFCIRDV